MIVVHLETRDAGFFSTFFFMVNQYLYAKINHQRFRLISDNWLFKSEKGWTDYFLPIDYDPIQPSLLDSFEPIEIRKHATILANYPFQLYRTIIPKMYCLNASLQKQCENARKLFFEKITHKKINTQEYGSLFIRRGDKLIEESLLIPAENYLVYLLEIYPNVRTVFVQTDDYNVFLELLECQTRVPSIQHLNLYTLCKPEIRGGMVITKEKYDYMRDPNFETNIQKIRIPENQEYLLEYRENLKSFLPLEMQTPEQVGEHTTDMLIGIDFLLKSKICVTDYLSNVTRFIKFAHPNFDAVYDILRQSNSLDMNIIGCPGYSANFYPPGPGPKLATP